METLTKSLGTDVNSPVSAVAPSSKFFKEELMPSMEQMQTALGTEEKFKKEKSVKEAQQQADILRKDVTLAEEENKKLREDPTRAKYQAAISQKESAAYIPDQENPERLATILALTNLMGVAIGRGGKANAQTALAAQNGMLEGYQKGRADIIKQQKDIFDETQKKLDKTIDDLHRGMQDAAILYAKDKEAGHQKAMLTMAENQASFMKDFYDKNGMGQTYEMSKQIYDMKNKKYEEMKKEEAKNAITPYQERMLLQGEERLKQGKRGLDIREKSSNAKLLKTTDDIQADLISRGVNISSPKDRAEVAKVVASMAELDSLRNDVINKPGLVGRQGQIQQFTDRYIKSYKGEAPPLDESKIAQADQDALLFSKKYASMLTRYEQALADGSRGFTVAFQKRYNDLLSQNQFNAPSMIKLFDDMSHEIASGAKQKSFKLTYGILEDMASNFQSGLEETTPVTKTATQPQFKSSSAPQSAIDHLKQHPELKDAFKTKYGYIPEGM